MVGFLRLCQHFAKRKLASTKDNDDSETTPIKKAKVEVKEDLDEEKKILNLGLKVERLPIKKDVETSDPGIWQPKPGFEFDLEEDKKDDFEAKPQLNADKLVLTKVLSTTNSGPVSVGHQNDCNTTVGLDGDDVQVVSQFIQLEKLVEGKAKAQVESDPWLDELNEAIVDCDNDDSTSNFVDVCFYKPLDLPLDICDKPISSSGTLARQCIPSRPSHQNTIDEIDVESIVPIPDIGQTQDSNVFLQSYFNPPCQNFFPFHKDLDQNESEAEMNDNGTPANNESSSSSSSPSSLSSLLLPQLVALPSSSGVGDMEKEIPLIWIDDESDSVKATKCGTVPTKPMAKGPPPSSIPSVTTPSWPETSLIRNYEILLSQHFSSRLNVDVSHCSGDTSMIQLTNFITPKTTFHPGNETASHDFLYPVSSSNGQFPTLANEVQEELVRHKRKAKKGKKKRKCKRRHCKKCKRRKSKSKEAREGGSELVNVVQDSAPSVSICERTSGIGSGTPSETSSTSGVADLMSDASSSTISEDHRVRLPSPEIIGSTRPDLDMVESETSDYQRSTPSPREHPPFLEESANRLKRENPDLGFGDEIKEDANPSVSLRNHFTISAKSFYNSTKPEAVLKSMQKIKSNKCLTVDLYPLPLISSSTKKKKKKKKKFKYLDDDDSTQKRVPSSSVLDTLKNNRVKVSKHFKLTQDPKIMYQQAQVKIKRLPVSANTIMSVSADLLSRVSVSPKKCRKVESELRANDWFSELTKPPKHAHIHSIKPRLPSSKNVFPSPERSLIRPAVLNVIATTPTKTDPEDDSMSGNRFSSPPQKSLSSSLRDTSNLVNPFLPLQKSSYLFGGTDDFEQNEEVIEYDEEETDDFSDPDVESNTPLTKVEEYDPPTDALHSPKDLKVIKSHSTLDLDHLFGLGDKSTPVKQGDTSTISTNAGATTPKIRFPAVQGPKNMIECKWNSCQKKFTTYGKLSDHLKACHVISQVFEQSGLDSEVYQCLWEGCKVYAKKSCSKSWLEKHVPTHGGKFAFACIVSGCKMRFSSQKILQRHVNHHFAQNDNDVSGTTPGSQCRAQNKKSRKYTDHNQSESTKNLKRAGVKLKFRHTVFSARIFDFFDPGIMAGIKHQVYNLEGIGSHKYNISGDSITFKSRVLGVKKHDRATANPLQGCQDNQQQQHSLHEDDGNDEDDDNHLALVRWTPENLLDDEWLPLGKIQTWKTVKICHLPEKAKVKLGQDLFGLGRSYARTSPPAPEINDVVHEKSTLISAIPPLQNGAAMSTTTSMSAGAPKGASRRKQYARPKPYL